MKTFWDYTGPVVGRLDLSWAVLAHLGTILGTSKHVLGRLEPILDLSEASLERLGRVLRDLSEASLERLGRVLRLS